MLAPSVDSLSWKSGVVHRHARENDRTLLEEGVPSHQLRVHTRDGSHLVDPDGRPIAPADDVVDGRTVQFGAGWHVREGIGATAYRWASDRAQLIIDAAAAQARHGAVVDLEVEANPYDARAWARVEVLGGDRPISRFHITGRMRLDILWPIVILLWIIAITVSQGSSAKFIHFDF